MTQVKPENRDEMIPESFGQCARLVYSHTSKTTFFHETAADFSPMKYIDAWQRFLAALANGEKPFPDTLLEILAKQTHIEQKNLRAGLQINLDGLSRPVTKSFPAFSLTNKRPVVAILAAGNIPGVALAPAILLSAAGCPVMIKQSQNERAFMPWVLQEMQTTYPSILELICANYWQAGSEPLKKMLAKVDCILAYGSSQTIENLKQDYPGKVIGFGHKISFAYVDQADYRKELGAKLALDVALYNQQGCLSVQAIFVKGTKECAGQWAASFTNALSLCIKKLGAHGSDLQTKMRLHAVVEAFQLQDIPCFRTDTGSGGIAVLPKFSPDYLIGNGFVEVIPVQDETEVKAQLEPFREYCQGMAIAADAQAFMRLKNVFEQTGFSYVCKPGKLQAPPLDWPNGGVILPEAVLRLK